MAQTAKITVMTPYRTLSGICSKYGFSKLNINTDLQVAWTNAVKTFLSSNDVYDPRVIIKSGEQAIKEVIYKKIELFESGNKK